MYRRWFLRCFWLAAFLWRALAAQNVITTIAGIDPTFSGDSRLAAIVPIGYVNGVATDSAGNVYFTDPIEHLVLRVAPNGILSVIAGNGIAGYSGDGGPATSAAIAATDNPEQYVPLIFNELSLGGIAVDQQGNVYFADGFYVRKVTPAGLISTFAGGGTNKSNTPMLATGFSLDIVNGLAFDSGGNLYLCEGNRIRKVTPSGTLSTYAGTGTEGFSGDGGPATAAQLLQPQALAFDAQGNLYVSDGTTLNFHIRMITPAGTITTIAGGGTKGVANGVAPRSLNLPHIGGLAFDAAGDLYAYGAANGILIKLSGTVANPFSTTTLITSSVNAAFMANVPANTAYVAGLRLFDNSGLAFDGDGNLYVADSADGYLCKIDSQGTLRVVAGNGNYSFGGDGGPAVSALIQGPIGMAQGPDGTVYFGDSLNHRVRAISPSGIINTALGPANYPALGDVENIEGVATDPSGDLYVLLTHRLLEMTPNGAVTALVDPNGLAGDSGDGGPAIDAKLEFALALARDSAGNLYIADADDNRIREVTTDGKIHSVAGTGVMAFTPDGAPAASSPISNPTSLLVDNLGGIYFQESPVLGLGNDIIRYITPGGILKTIAGNGKGGFTGDGGPATQAGLEIPERTGMALDKLGNLYIADGFNNRVRVVSLATGIIKTFAGNGVAATAGDGGTALDASLIVPLGLLVDTKGDLLISDIAGNRIRSVLSAAPAISATPIKMTFTGKSGGAETPPQNLSITSPVTGLGFSISVSPGANWVVLDANSGAAPQLVTVRGDPSTLSPGSYDATLTVTSPLGAPQNTNIALTFQVEPPDNPMLAVDATGLSFTFPSNPATTLTKLVRIANSGTGALAFTVTEKTNSGGNWLRVSPTSGSATPKTPANISVTANPVGLASGTYTGTITIASSTTGQSVTVMVNLTVSTLDQAIQLSHSGLSFTAVAGGGVVPPETFGVNNIGRGTMNFTVSSSTLSGGPWLSATTSSGVATSGAPAPPVTVSVNQAGLAPGFYFGQVRVDAPAAANSPHVASVALHVLAAGQDPGPVITPSDLVVTTVQGDPSPGSQRLFVYNISATPQNYVSHLSSSNANDQFELDPAAAMLSPAQPTPLVIQPLTTNLPVGVYDATLTLQFSDGVLRRVRIRTVVTPAPAAAAADRASRARASAASCTPSQLVPVITTLGQEFGVPAAWPVPIETQVTDDCGNQLNSGSVKVAFSNGDPPLSLLAMQGGLWQTTWVSGNTSGPVTVTLTATDPTGTLTGTREVTGGLADSSGSPIPAAAVSGASFAGNTPLAPGNIISLFGTNMANGSAAASAIPLTDTLAGASVVMAGVELPMLYSSTGQINAVVSGGININTNQQVLVQRGNTYSIPISVDVGPSEPAIFAYPLPGDPPNQGAIVNALTYNVAQPGTPVTGGDILAIFCTGLGAVSPAVPDGAGAPSSPLSTTVATPTVTVGGTAAQVTFSGLSPGFVGLYQIDAVVPSGITPSNQVPVVITIAGQTSPSATIAVK